MSVEFGEFALRWTVRAAVAAYLVRVVVDLGGRRSPRMLSLARWAWTAGAVLLLIHTLLAYGVRHGWSHEEAWQHNVEQTAATTGWAWGGGLFLNHALLVWWVFDALAWWRHGLRSPDEHPLLRGGMHATFAFMILNATVVFGPPIWRPIGAAVGLVLVIISLTRSPLPVPAD